MADKSESIRVKGLTEFRRELAKLDDAIFLKRLKQTNFDMAQLVIGRAKAGAALPVQRKASGSLKASRAASKAQISYGGYDYEYALGAEFGATQYSQFPPFLGRTGYFLYPAVRSLKEKITVDYMAAIDDITSAAFPD